MRFRDEDARWYGYIIIFFLVVILLKWMAKIFSF